MTIVFMGDKQYTFSFYDPCEDKKHKRTMQARFDKEVIGQLKARRYELRHTQEYVNEKIGIAERLLNKWECGDRLPSSFNMFCWADALDCDIVIVPRGRT